MSDDPAVVPTTRRLRVDAGPPDAATVEAAAAILRRGGTVAFPTETVYGLGADACSEAAVRRIFTAKGRPADNPLIVHVTGRDALDGVVRAVPAAAERLIEAFWPGPLTLVLPRDAAVPDVTTARLDSVGVRAPDHPVAQALLRATGMPLAAPSANRSGAPSPTTAAHVLADLEGRIDAVLDGGACRVGLESTVVRVDGPLIQVLRLGAVTPAMLSSYGEVVIDPHASGAAVASSATVASPGLKHRHYTPRAEVRVFEGADRVARLQETLVTMDPNMTGVVSTSAVGAAGPLVRVLGAEDPAVGYAHGLYAALRELDAAGCSLILVEGIEPEGLGAAVMDRLRRAAAR